MKGTVVRSTGSWYTVKTEDNQLVECRIRGKFRIEGIKTTNPVAVGDIVSISINEEDSTYNIYEIDERRNYIIRQSPKKRTAHHILAANIDQAIMVVTYDKPRTSTGFIDRFLVTAEAYHIPVHLIFNKQDVLDEKGLQKQQAIIDIYDNINYPTYKTAAEKGEGIETVKALMKDKTTLVAGHSGVGKSTLINAVVPDLELRTKAISDKFNKGVHTTTFAEMHTLPFGGSIVDIPGIKEFGMSGFPPEEIGQFFVEIQDLSNECKFNNCLHLNEPKCAIRQAVADGEIHEERYKNYLNIVTDLQENYKHWEG